MLPKPTPKELVVEAKPHSNVIFIYVSTPDAENWLKSNIDEFGTVYPPNIHSSYYSLFVSKTYDVQEVAAYLNSYNNKE